MKLYNFFLVLLLLDAESCSAANAQAETIIGVWNCGPYSMKNEGYTVTATEMADYSKNGTFRGTSEITVQTEGGKVIKTRNRSFGNWSLTEGVIEIRYDKIDFLYSSDPAYTLQMGQSVADTQLKKKSWAKSKILELGARLVTVPVGAMYKSAEVMVTCVRPLVTSATEQH